jgi:hypothetical protein
MVITGVGILKLCVNRITPEILRERLAGAVKRTGKGVKRQSRIFEEADFTVRKKTVKSSRSGTTHFRATPGHFSINPEDSSQSSTISALVRTLDEEPASSVSSQSEVTGGNTLANRFIPYLNGDDQVVAEEK